MIFAVVAALGAYKYLNELTVKANVKELPYTIVVVAKVDIPMNKEITKEDIEQRRVVEGDNHPNVFKEEKDLIGKIAVTKISVGEQIIASRVASKGDAEMGLGFIVSEGMRAVTVAISEVTGVGYMIKPSDRVDLLVRVTKEEPDKKKKVAVSTLLQNVKVLALGSNLHLEPASEKQGEVKTITVEVYPQEAEKIFLASQDAVLLFTLRSPGENSIKQVPHVEYEDLAPSFFSNAKTQSTAVSSPNNVTNNRVIKKAPRGR